MPACCVSFQLSLMKSEERLSATIEQLQRWIGQKLRGSGSRKFPISYPVFAFSFALGRDQAPVSRQAWTIGAADKSIVIEVPHGRSLHRGAVERIIGLAVPVEVGRSDQSIAAYNARPECASDERGAGQIPDCRLTGAGIEKQIIGFVIAIEVRHADHSPVSWQGWTKGAADKNIVIEVPNRCLPCSGIVQHIIWLAILIEIIRRWRRLERQTAWAA